MEIHSLTTILPGNYPVPHPVARPTPPATPPQPAPTAVKPLVNSSSDNQSATQRQTSYRNAQPLYDQHLSARGQRAQQTYNGVEHSSETELMNRVDVFA